MPDPLDSVNVTVATWRRLAARPDADPDNARTLAQKAADFEAVAEELAKLRIWAKPVPASYGDLSDLPAELVAQLSGVKTDALEDQIHAVVKAAGDEIELDRLLIELYRRFGDIHQRRFLNNKCYRMAQKGLIHLIKGRKGVYTIHPQSGAEDAPSEEEDDGATVSNFKPSPRETFTADLDDEIPF